jgi:hypothetical protein
MHTGARRSARRSRRPSLARAAFCFRPQRLSDDRLQVLAGQDQRVVVEADLRAFTEVVLGRRTLSAALRERRVKLQGPAALVRSLPRWLPLRGEAKRGMGLVPAPA